MPLTFKDVAEILKIIDTSQCEEVVIELQGLRLHVRRGGEQRPAVGGSHARPGLAAPVSGESGPLLARAGGGGSARAPGATRADISVAEGHVAVRAPMVGTFYRRPAPDQPPFVEVGARVAAGDPLCLIEVMKLYTTVAAPIPGVLAAIVVEDNAAVEFDQLLFVISPHGPDGARGPAGQGAA